MPQAHPHFDSEQSYKEQFLSRLSQGLAAPTAEWPTVRCWTGASFLKICRHIRDEMALAGTKSSLSHKALLEWLQRLGLVRMIQAQRETFYLFDIGGANGTDADPLELLMAAKPGGVICYFSAVAFHSLTTQPAAHHHTAELQPPQPSPLRPRAKGLPESGRRGATEEGDDNLRSLGKLLFQYQDLSFYSTRRSSRLVPGVQSRAHGARTRIRITTREQTLLDTLYKPHHCGGPAVVFEAWQTALSAGGLDEERLADYLRQMQYPATTRRTGAMFEILGYSPGTELSCLLEEQRKAIDPEGAFARISLLPGVSYTNLNERWLVNTP